MISLYKYLSEALNDNSWTKVSNREYNMNIEDVNVLSELIPYKELSLDKLESLTMRIFKEGPRWVGILEWNDKHNKYVCNGWKCGNNDLDVLKQHMINIMNHLSSSKDARKHFKNTMMKILNNFSLLGYKDRHDMLDKYDGTVSINSLDDLLDY